MGVGVGDRNRLLIVMLLGASKCLKVDCGDGYITLNTFKNI